MTDIQTEEFTDLVSPAGLPDLTQAEVARSLPLVALSLAIGRSTPFLEEYLNNPLNKDVMPVLERFQTWATKSAIDGEDPWLEYLADCRATLLEAAWSAYDPEGHVEDAVRDLVGDELLGNALWFSFLRSTGIINEDDEARWTNLWTFAIISDLFGDDGSDGETVNDDQSMRRSDW